MTALAERPAAAPAQLPVRPVVEPADWVVKLSGGREAARHTALLLRLRWRTIRNPVARVLLLVALALVPVLVIGSLATGSELSALLSQRRAGNLRGFGLDTVSGVQRLAAALTLATPLGLISPLTGVSTPPLAEPEDLGVLRPSRLGPATDGLVTVMLTPLSVVQLLTLSLAAGLFSTPHFPGPLLILLVLVLWLTLGATTSLLGWIREDARRRWALRRASQGKETRRSGLLTALGFFIAAIVGFQLRTSGAADDLVTLTVKGLRPVGQGELDVVIPALLLIAGLGVASVAGTLRWADAALRLPTAPPPPPRVRSQWGRKGQNVEKDVRSPREDGGGDTPRVGLSRMMIYTVMRVPECRNPLTTVTALTMGGVLIAVLRGNASSGGAGQVSGTLVPIGVALAAGVNGLSLLGPGCVWILSEPRARYLLPAGAVPHPARRVVRAGRRSPTCRRRSSPASTSAGSTGSPSASSPPPRWRPPGRSSARSAGPSRYDWGRGAEPSCRRSPRCATPTRWPSCAVCRPRWRATGECRSSSPSPSRSSGRRSRCCARSGAGTGTPATSSSS